MIPKSEVKSIFIFWIKETLIVFSIVSTTKTDGYNLPIVELFFCYWSNQSKKLYLCKGEYLKLSPLLFVINPEKKMHFPLGYRIPDGVL